TAVTKLSRQSVAVAVKAFLRKEAEDIGGLVPVDQDKAHSVLSPDYPDYGLPHPRAYATAKAPFIFMGVDFTEPFAADAFPLPVTSNRLGRLKYFLSLCKRDAAEAQETFPAHLRALFSRTKNALRNGNARLSDRFEPLLNDPDLQHIDAHSRLSGTNFYKLSHRTLTNDRPICVFLWDAPLSRKWPNWSCDVTMTKWREMEWDPRTVVLAAKDASRLVRPRSITFLFDHTNLAQLAESFVVRLAHNADIDSSLLETNSGISDASESSDLEDTALKSQVMDVDSKAVQSADVTATHGVMDVDKATMPHSYQRSTSAAAEQQLPQSDSLPSPSHSSHSVIADRPRQQEPPMVLKEKQLLNHRVWVKNGIAKHIKGSPEEWVEYRATLQPSGAICADLKARTDRGPVYRLAAGLDESSDSASLSAAKSLAGGTFHTFVNAVRRLPLELIIMILAHACESHAQLFRMNGAFGRYPLLSPDRIREIGPVFIPPEWDRPSTRLSNVLPRVSDPGIQKQQLVDEVQRSLIFPSATLHTIRLVEIWKLDAMHGSRGLRPKELAPVSLTSWEQPALPALPASGKDRKSFVTEWPAHRWIKAQEAAVDLTGRLELRQTTSLQWRGKQRSTRIANFFTAAMAVIHQLGKMNRLQRLDLRLGAWALHTVLDEFPKWDLDEVKLYGLFSSFHRLKSLTFMLDWRKWNGDEEFSNPEISLSRLLGYSDTGVLEPPHRPRFEFLNIILPSAILYIVPSALLSRLGSITKFAVVCSSMASSVSTARLCHAIAEHCAQTLEELMLVVLDDANSNVKQTYDKLRSETSMAGPPEVESDEESISSPTRYRSTNIGRSLGPLKVEVAAPAPVHLPRLTRFHFEGEQLPLSIFRQLHMPYVELLVVRTTSEFMIAPADYKPLSVPFKYLQAGGISWFKNKQDAIRAFNVLTDSPSRHLLQSGAFKLYSEGGQRFAGFEEDTDHINTHTIDKNSYLAVSASMPVTSARGCNTMQGLTIVAGAASVLAMTAVPGALILGEANVSAMIATTDEADVSAKAVTTDEARVIAKATTTDEASVNAMAATMDEADVSARAATTEEANVSAMAVSATIATTDEANVSAMAATTDEARHR
ncbi:hypothetical protein OC844_007159, partial [Tilletia horrida]